MNYYPTKIKNNEVIINDVPFSKWTQREWGMWKQNTNALMAQTQVIGEKLQMLARMKGWAI